MKKKFSLAAVFFVALAVLAVAISYSAAREAYRNRKIDNEVKQLQQEADKIGNENSDLSERIAYLQTPEFQEKVAKEKLNMQKPDENVVVVKPGTVQQTDLQAAESGDDTDQKEAENNYKKWWDTFFKYE